MYIGLLSGFLFLINAAAFIVCGADKRAAGRGKRRVSEKMLLVLCAAGGGAGFAAGMIIFNHKTKKLKFRICVPLFMFAWFVVLWFMAAKELF